jgi:hypothetical protein
MLTRLWVLVAILAGVVGAFAAHAEECHNRCGTIMSCFESVVLECSNDAHDFTRDACFTPDLRVV